MEMKSSIGRGVKLGVGLIFVAAITLVGCGGGSSTNNTPANTALTSAQIAALTPAQIATYTNTQIAALGVNIKYLNDLSLAALKTTGFSTDPGNQQVQSITSAQIAVLSPAQVRLIGATATGSGGVLGVSQIAYLNAGAWAALVGNPAQVAAISAPELVTFSNAQIVAIDINIKYLNNQCLAALKTTGFSTDLGNQQVQSITAAQIAALNPAQVRLIGAAATGSGGVLGTSQIAYFNTGAWAALVSDPLQVLAITPAEVATLTFNGSEKIISMGANLNLLTNAALGVLTVNIGGMGGGQTQNGIQTQNGGQIQALSAVQVMGLSPAQVGVIAGINVTNVGIGVFSAISYLNAGAFSSLNAAQVAVLTPAHVVNVSAAQLASLSTTAIAGLAPATIASLTVAQKASLSPTQHTACAC